MSKMHGKLFDNELGNRIHINCARQPTEDVGREEVTIAIESSKSHAHLIITKMEAEVLSGLLGQVLRK